MTVISAPSRLRWAACFLFWSVPIAACEVLTISRHAFESLTVPVGFAAGVSVVLSYGFLRGRVWALPGTATVLAMWCLVSVWMAARMKLPSLGFFSVFLLLGSGALLHWLKSELGRSFFDPMMSWFQGVPQAIPGVSCRLNVGDFESEFQVCRVDNEGAFLFAQNGLLPRIPGSKAELEFHFRERQIRCHGTMMRVFARGAQGAGFQFKDMSPDTKKELGDFVELLRGEGYVN